MKTGTRVENIANIQSNVLEKMFIQTLKNLWISKQTLLQPKLI